MPPSPPFCPYLGKDNVYAKLLAFCLYQVKLCLCIGRELIDSYYAGQLVYVGNVAYMLQQVRKSLLQSLQVLIVEVSLCHTAVVFQRTNSCYDYNCIRFQACHTAFDVEEFLGSEVCAEASLVTV